MPAHQSLYEVRYLKTLGLLRDFQDKIFRITGRRPGPQDYSVASRKFPTLMLRNQPLMLSILERADVR